MVRIKRTCTFRKKGAVAAIMPNGSHLGVKPNELEIIEWHQMPSKGT